MRRCEPRPSADRGGARRRLAHAGRLRAPFRWPRASAGRPPRSERSGRAQCSVGLTLGGPLGSRRRAQGPRPQERSRIFPAVRARHSCCCARRMRRATIRRIASELTASAYEAAPAYAPATWALHHESRKQGDIEATVEPARARGWTRQRSARSDRPSGARGARARGGRRRRRGRAADACTRSDAERPRAARVGDPPGRRGAGHPACGSDPEQRRARAPWRCGDLRPWRPRRPSRTRSQPARALTLLRSRPAGAAERSDCLDGHGACGTRRGQGCSGRRAEAAPASAGERPAFAARGAGVLARTRPRQRLARRFLQTNRAPSSWGSRAELLELDPRHASALRVLERRAMESNDYDGLWDIEERLAGASSGLKRSAGAPAFARPPGPAHHGKGSGGPPR